LSIYLVQLHLAGSKWNYKFPNLKAPKVGSEN